MLNNSNLLFFKMDLSLIFLTYQEQVKAYSDNGEKLNKSKSLV